LEKVSKRGNVDKTCSFTIQSVWKSTRYIGVFFRKYTLQEATILGLMGWVMNTTQGIVKGEAQGSKDQIVKFQDWLRFTASPQSKVTKLQSDYTFIDQITFQTFEIIK
jgi:acylphosphatase